MNAVTRTAKADRCLHGSKHEEMSETAAALEIKLNLNSRFYQKWVKIKLNSFPHSIKAPVISSQCLKGNQFDSRDLNLVLIPILDRDVRMKAGQQGFNGGPLVQYERPVCFQHTECVKLECV